MESVAKYYDEQSRTYDAQFDTLYYKIYDKITWKYTEPYVPTTPRSLALDAGGGTGRWSIPIARKGCKVVLVDISQKMLAKAQAKIEQEGLEDQLTIKKGNILDLDFPDETFDLVFCDHTLFLFPDANRAVKELTRVLEKHSTMIISAQNRYPLALMYLPDEPKKAIELIYGRHHHKLGDIKVYTLTPNEFKKILEANKLKVEKIIGKVITMPTKISPRIYFRKEYTKDLFNKILQIELALSEKSDLLGLAGHLQAIVSKL